MNAGNEIIETIASDGDNKLIDDAINKLRQNFKRHDCCALHTCLRLVFMLYIEGQNESALSLTKLVEDITFDKDYNTWTPIEYLLILKSRMERENGDPTFQDKLRNDINPTVLITGNKLQKEVKKTVFEGRLRGDGIEDRHEDVLQAMKDHDRAYELESRFMYSLWLYYISEYGGSDEFTVERAEKLISENQDRIRELISWMKQNDNGLIADFIQMN